MRSEKHLQNRAGGTVFLENTFNTSILQRDGKINEEYLDPKVFLPINIKDFHWYLAVVDGINEEIHMLDSLGKTQENR
ncbi:hypothetical protein BDA96_07G120300 [Sorghum bicolor]|uniref:Ubiquitin-like protease family profile domain-containing protein n=1 Tax=Sorghum bicolor TaxID=4558 RepID=A0A921QMZ3_SORBI|nr:hypothetical protein BDA96_07G120300 [Sorghum bicolor]